MPPGRFVPAHQEVLTVTMTNIQQYQSGSGLAAPGQTRLPASTRKALAHLQQQAVLSAARFQAQEYLSREAMFAVTALSELEGQLATMCPLATSRLEFIANTAAMSIARTLNGF